MPAYVSSLIYLMAVGTALLDVALVVKVFALLHKPSRAQILRASDRYGMLAIFILSTLAVAGTLLMQYAGGLNPCLLCWWQRVCMYPIPLISFIAFVKGQKLSQIADYILALSVFGFAIALYQHLLQVLPSGALIPCDPTNDCAVRSVFELGFVTLPWMAVTIFATLVLITLLARKRA